MTHPRLLPAERELAEMLGWSEDQMLRYWLAVRRRAAAQPEPLAVAGPGAVGIISLSLTVLSVGYSLLALALQPRPRRPGEVRSRSVQGESVNSAGRFAPRPGFEGVQDVAVLGATVPIVVARREFLPALNGRPEGFYGGCRVNAEALWTRLSSTGGGQLYQCLYLLGEGRISGLDLDAFAIGSTPLRSYDLGSAGGNETGSRLTIYYRPDGGRIVSADRVAGRLAANDPGNAQNFGGSDVLQVRSVGNAWRSDACAATRPSSSAVFGVYSPMPNGMALRVSPTLRPTRVITLRPSGTTGNQRIEPNDDPSVMAAIWKAKYAWSTRSGISGTSTGVTSGDAVLPVGATFTYVLRQETDYDTRLAFNSSNTDQGADVVEAMRDVASAVASRQRAADEALVVGELFKAGSCLAVLESRSPDSAVFVSNADVPLLGGTAITCTFRVVAAGTVQVTPTIELNPAITGTQVFPPRVTSDLSWDWTRVTQPPSYQSGTSRAQLMRVAVSDITLPRPARVFEIGYRSKVGVRVGGLCNFPGCPTIREINRQAGGERAGQVISAGASIDVAVFTSGVINRPETRFTFWRVSYRAEGSSTFTELPWLFGVRGSTQQEAYEGIRVEMPSVSRWEVRHVPVSGWEVRIGVATGDLAILDANQRTERSATSGGVTVWWMGEPLVTRSAAMFRMESLEPQERSTLTALVTTTAAVRAFAGTYTGVQLIQNGRDRGGRATVVVPAGGGFNSAAITLTAPGSGYDGSAITLANGTNGDAVIGTRSFVVTSSPGPGGVGFRLTVPTNTPLPRIGSRVSFTTTTTLPAPLAAWTVYWVVGHLSSTEFTVSLTSGGAVVTPTNAGTGTHTCTQWVNAYTITADSTTDRLTVTGGPNAPVIDTPIQIAAQTTMPAPLVAGTTYWVVANPTATTMQVSATQGGAVIDITSNGAGTITARISAITNWAGTGTLGPTDLGLGWTEGQAMVDEWGRLAESFVYDELQSSAAAGPEHEVVYINTITENDTAPLYPNMGLLALSIRSGFEFQQLGQVSAYVTGGTEMPRALEGTVGPTHLLPDVFTDAALNTRYGMGSEITPEQINTAAMVSAAQWCFDRRYFYDGVKPDPENIRSWAGEIAPKFLLSFVEQDGQFAFVPAVSFDPVEVKDLFTAGNIQTGTFKWKSLDEEARQPIRMSGVWRDERASADVSTPGMFAVRRQVSIRSATGSDSDPVEPMDLGDFCTNRLHLIDAMKLAIRWRELIDHAIEFETTYQGVMSRLGPEDHFALAFDVTVADTWSNGSCLADGSLTAVRPLEDGSYPVMAWDGITGPGPTMQTLVVTGGGTRGNLPGTVWSRVTPAAQLQTYRVMRVTPTPDGRQKIEAVVMPLDGTGRQLLTADWDSGSAWVIEG